MVLKSIFNVMGHDKNQKNMLKYQEVKEFIRDQ